MFRESGSSAMPGWTSAVLGTLLDGDFRIGVAGLGPERLEGKDGVDILVGSAGDEWLDGGADSDILLGGPGADTLMGGSGRDALWGGPGTDLFRFTANDAAQAEADVVVDFSQADGDRIDLSAFGDVNPWMPGEQGFEFVGNVTGVFRPAVYVPGEVTFIHDEGFTLVTANVDDRVLHILLIGHVDLEADDFLF